MLKLKVATIALVALLSVQGTMGVSHADSDSAADLTLHMVSLPLRLVGGAATGLYGMVTGGGKGTYEMATDVNDRIVEKGSSPAQVLLVPITAPIGFIKGAATGFSEHFPTGYNLIDNDSE